MSRISTWGHDLYEGRVSIDFVGRRRLWYRLSAVIVLAALGGLLVRGLDLGIEFTGGVELTTKVESATPAQADRLREALVDSGIEGAANPIVVTSGSDLVRIQIKALDQSEVLALETDLKEAGALEVSQNLIGPSWGQQVATKALTGLVVFLALVVLFIWAYFRQWRMSVAALVALAHDLLITIGVYAWSGFEVTPATVTGLLTILGFSLYDTVVVFDKVRENTAGVLESPSRTFAERANLAVNQTLVRSINTSVTALLPVLALLVVGVAALGSGPLKDLALALFVGMAAGTYSSICIATPLAVQLREREDAISTHTRKVLARRERVEATGSPSAAETAELARPVQVSGSAGRRQPKRSTRSSRSSRS